MFSELLKGAGLDPSLSVFLGTFAMVFIAELFDKSQLAVMGLTTKYKVRDIALGVIASSLVANFVAISFGSMFSTYVFLGYVRIALSLGFLVAGILSVLNIGKPAKKAEERTYSPFILPLSIAVTLAMSEIGDKTQLQTLILSASHIPELVWVFFGATLGTIAGAFVWIPAVRFLRRKLSKIAGKYMPFTMFSVFGFYNLFFSIQDVGLSQGMQLVLWGGMAVVFAMLSTLLIENNERRF